MTKLSDKLQEAEVEDALYSADLAADLLVDAKATELVIRGLRAHVNGGLDLTELHFEAPQHVARQAVDVAEILAKRLHQEHLAARDAQP